LISFKGQGSHPTAVAFSPDGTRLATTAGDSSVAVWNATAARTVAIPNGRVDSLAVGAEGKFLYGGGRDRPGLVWGVATRPGGAATGREVRAVGPAVPLSHIPLAVHPTGRQVVTFAFGALEVWGPQEGRRLRQLPNTILQAAAYSPDGEHLATLTPGGTHIRS